MPDGNQEMVDGSAIIIRHVPVTRAMCSGLDGVFSTPSLPWRQNKIQLQLEIA